MFKFGDKVLLRADSMELHTSKTCIQIDNVNVLALLKQGDEVRFGEDACVFGEVESSDSSQVTLMMKGGGTIKSNDVVKVPGLHYQCMPILRAGDHDHIADIAIKHNFDYIIVPYVQTA